MEINLIFFSIIDFLICTDFLKCNFLSGGWYFLKIACHIDDKDWKQRVCVEAETSVHFTAAHVTGNKNAFSCHRTTRGHSSEKWKWRSFSNFSFDQNTQEVCKKTNSLPLPWRFLLWQIWGGVRNQHFQQAPRLFWFRGCNGHPLEISGWTTIRGYSTLLQLWADPCGSRFKLKCCAGSWTRFIKDAGWFVSPLPQQVVSLTMRGEHTYMSSLPEKKWGLGG